MVNIEQITSTLAKLPDQALQRYAAMHKDDPYIMSLAVSESKRRKDMRSASQARPMQQPKVADQALAEMAPQQQPQMPGMPEQQGIGSLPAAAQMNFADGGITGYAGGGEVEHYQYGGMPPRSSMTGDIPGFVAGTGNFIPQPGQPEEEPYLRKLYRQMAEQAEASRAAEARRRVAEGRAAPAATPGAAAPVANPAQDMAQFDAASNLYMTERAGKQAEDAAATAKAGIGQKLPPAPVPRASLEQPKAPKAEGLEALQGRLMEEINAEREGFKTQREGIVGAQKTLKEKNLAEFEAESAKRDDVYKGREERLAKQGEKIEGLGDKYLGLSLLQAGAAMMTTPGGIGAALGKGVAVGSERYASGMEKINAAQEKFADAKDKLDDLRTNREDMTSSERRKLKSEIAGTELEGKKFLYEGAVSDLGIKHKDVDSLFGALAKEQQSKAEIASRDRATASSAASARAQLEATLSTPEKLAFQGYLANTVTKEKPLGDPAKAYEAMVSAKRDPVTEEKLREKWLDPISRMQIKKDYPEAKTADEYIAAVKAAGSLGAPAAASGKVPPPPPGFR